MLLNCDRECRAGRAVAAPPGRRRPRGRGWAGLIRVPGCHFSAGEQQRLQSVQWLGRGARGVGAHGVAWGAVRRGQRWNAEDVPSWGRCPWFPGIRCPAGILSSPLTRRGVRVRQTCAIVISLWLLPVWRLSHESETVPLKCVSWQALGEYVRRLVLSGNLVHVYFR